MSNTTPIQWTDATWNPVRGCSRVSKGCEHCYAEEIAARFSGPGLAYEGLAKRVGGDARWTNVVRFLPDKLDWPLRWKGAPQAKAEGRPSRIFVNSMSDLFHEGLPDEASDRVFAVMALAPQHTFQVLTKRPERMRAYLTGDARIAVAEAIELRSWARETHNDFDARDVEPLEAWPLANVWLGVSAENQETADERIPLLLQCPAAVRFVSYEPALGPVDFTRWLPCSCGGRRFVDDECWTAPEHWDGSRAPGDGLIPCGFCNEGGWDAEVCAPRRGLDWLIVGGESGRSARPFDVDWARSAIRQCREAGVPVFCKQLGAHVITDGVQAPGEWWPDQSASAMEDTGKGYWRRRLRDGHGGNPDEWPADLRMREFPV